MIRCATLSLLSSVLLLACKPARAPELAPAPTPVAAAPAPAGPEVHEIPLAGDGRTFTFALAESATGAVLFATEPTGIGRHALDIDARTSARIEVVELDRYPHVAAYDPVHDRLWWAAALDQLRITQPTSGGFPAGDRVLTHSSTVAHDDGLRGVVRVCPAADTFGGGPLCDHELNTLLPAFGGVVLGGHLAERVGQSSAEAWIGFVNADGLLSAQQRIPDGMGKAWIGALAASDAGVLAVVWSGRGEPARSSFLLFDGPTLARSSKADRKTLTSISNPWSAAVAAPDGSFWVVLTTLRHELTIVSIARDGSITAEHAIAGAELPISSVQALGLRDGQPWLLIAKQYHEPSLWAGRIDPATGDVPELHQIALPRELVPERTLALDRGFLLAGRVNLERPLAVWIPLAGY